MILSVITIAYNDLAGLQRTIASVKGQTWTEIEHVIVDGGSTDGSHEWLKENGAGLTWVSEPDGGRYDAMNKGSLLASGDILWFMNSADTFHAATSVAEAAVSFMADTVDWGYGLSRIVNGVRVLGIRGVVPFERARFLLGGNVVPHQAAAFRKTFFRSLGGYDVNFGLTSDQLLMMKASLTSEPTVWTQVLCDFDASGAGSTRGVWAHYRDMIRARRALGIKVTPFVILDTFLSVWLAFTTKAERIQRRILRAAKPASI